MVDLWPSRIIPCCRLLLRIGTPFFAVTVVCLDCSSDSLASAMGLRCARLTRTRPPFTNFPVDAGICTYTVAPCGVIIELSPYGYLPLRFDYDCKDSRSCLPGVLRTNSERPTEGRPSTACLESRWLLYYAALLLLSYKFCCIEMCSIFMPIFYCDDWLLPV